jgi:Rrf2 family protein
MKLSAHEEYGLRCLLQIGRHGDRGGLTIPQISRLEGLSIHHAAKILHILKQTGFLKSVRGQTGGYTLAKPPEQIFISDVLSTLGGKLYEEDFCSEHRGRVGNCTHTVDCSIRSLWRMLQTAVDEVLSKTTLRDLIRKEDEMSTWLDRLVTLPTGNEPVTPRA